jgi:type II secretory ATPase GspE/PulE/Tfp pilus assembly ATPase PilB-like protein
LLVRTLCPACLGKDEGCKTCGGSRYTSRQLIAEAIHFKNAGEVLAAERGERWWPSIVDDGRRVLEADITDYAEISRVLGTQLNSDSEEKS